MKLVDELRAEASKAPDESHAEMYYQQCVLFMKNAAATGEQTVELMPIRGVQMNIAQAIMNRLTAEGLCTYSHHSAMAGLQIYASWTKGSEQ